MQGVRHSAHFFFVSESGREACIDAMYFSELPTDEQDQKGIEVGQKLVESLLGEPVKPMTDDQINDYLKRKTEEQYGSEVREEAEFDA